MPFNKRKKKRTLMQEENLLDSMHKHKPERRKDKITLLQAKG
jgi:hypothetical protein